MYISASMFRQEPVKNGFVFSSTVSLAYLGREGLFRYVRESALVLLWDSHVFVSVLGRDSWVFQPSIGSS